MNIQFPVHHSYQFVTEHWQLLVKFLGSVHCYCNFAVERFFRSSDL